LEDLKFGVTFIRDSYFEEYMSDYFYEVNQVDEALECYIDIEAFARDQQYDYASVNFHGIDYWYRQH
jgi:antirestriction protein